LVAAALERAVYGMFTRIRRGLSSFSVKRGGLF
jgi:hypothetical protein